MPIFKHEPRRPYNSEGRGWLALRGVCPLRLNANHLSSFLLDSMETLASWRLKVQVLLRQTPYTRPDPSTHSWETQLSFPKPGLLFEEGRWLQPRRAAKPQSLRVTQSCLSLPAPPQTQTIY